MELEITWPRLVRLWWAYLWRNLLTTVVAMIFGAFVGGILGAIMGAAGFSIQTIQIVGFPIGLIIGLVASLAPMRLILGRNYGEFRLVLLATDRSNAEGP
jgi:hypothetical protein